MRLYSSPTSPYVRKVHVVLRETEQWDDVEMAPSGGTPLDSGTNPVALNPLGKIPTLERDNGATIYDSRVICRFLDDRVQAGLYATGARQWELLTLEATADGILDAVILMVYERRLRPEDKQFQPWIDGQWRKVETALDTLERRWMSHLSGKLNIGQIAIGCALGYLDLRFEDRNWRKGRDDLAKFYDTFSQRDSMIATVPQG
ncbi:glutathione S-transferase [Litoreibacter roseus]|uniref:Glutathione S-transferase n=1 Tax=Litoreibacter roseus TaxID=2601869 RepID=A0A6N6JDB3_9RHOB|nr:glutathione S-transferase [Litoreibacter roseus]GFE64343.1 glutathione S-transferase [Litoreibacter roseus]